MPYRGGMRLTASADPKHWVPITGSGGRHRRGAIALLQSRSNAALAQATGTSGRAMGWLIRRLMPRAIRAMNGRMLVWAWHDDPALLVATAGVQELTPQARAARASMPMEYDDTEAFRGALGVGERLVLPHPPEPGSLPLALYTWDTGTVLITLTVLCRDAAKLGEVLPVLDALARSIRLDDAASADPDVIRLPPA